MEYDDADKKILAALQHDARTPLDQLAHSTGQSLATVQRRVKRLRQRGVIENDVSILNPAELGYKMTFIVLVEMDRESVDVLRAFQQKIQKEEQVQQCYYVTGDADFALICLARDMSDYEQLTQRLFFEDASVRRFRTNVVMKRTKVGLKVRTN